MVVQNTTRECLFSFSAVAAPCTRCEWASLRVCSESWFSRYHFFYTRIASQAARSSGRSFVSVNDDNDDVAITMRSVHVWTVRGFDFNGRDSGIHINEGSLNNNNNNWNVFTIKLLSHVAFYSTALKRWKERLWQTILIWPTAIDKNKWIYSPSAFAVVLSHSPRELLSNSFRLKFNYK